MFEQSVLDNIQVIYHSCIRIGGEKVIYIDPLGIKGAPRDADLILFTHPHFDHFSPRDVKKLLKDDTVLAAPKSMAAMCRLLTGREVVPLLPDQLTELCGIQIKTVIAYNNAKPFHLKAMKWLGYIITVGQTEIYVSGDTDITEESRSVSCDIAILPVGGFYTVDPEQAAELASEIASHTAIPIHYGKLLGGEEAAERFAAALGNDIRAEIRPSAYSTILVQMYARAAVLVVLCGALGYIIGKLI